MEKVLGIGGFFFRAKEPNVLARWCAEHLGVALPPESYDQRSWEQQQGATVFAPFGADSERRARGTLTGDRDNADIPPTFAGTHSNPLIHMLKLGSASCVDSRVSAFSTLAGASPGH